MQFHSTWSELCSVSFFTFPASATGDVKVIVNPPLVLLTVVPAL